MNDMWKGWAGRTVGGKFPLQNYLGGSDHSAVFLTVRQEADGSDRAAIKLIPPSHANGEKQLLRWQGARELNHPNLIRVFEAGQCELDGTELLYVVEEYAEENLSQILPERALTPAETRGMLPPVLEALQFLHDKGLVHGHIRPSNIFAIGDQVKLSSDGVRVPSEWEQGAAASAYDPPEAATATVSTAADVWQLGMMLIEVLTQHLPVIDIQENRQPVLPAAIPQPFGEVMENCLRINPADRCTVAEIADRLEAKQPEAATRALTTPATSPAAMPASVRSDERGKRSPKWPYVLALLAAVAIVWFLVARPKPPAAAPAAETADQQNSNAGSSPSTQPGLSTSQPISPGKASGGARPSPSASASAASGQGAPDGMVIERVMPQIPAEALHSIRGKIRIQVRVNVDEAGRVSEARLKSPGPSRYFAGKALEAARGWKFKPPVENGQPVRSQWVVQFTLNRRAIDDSLIPVKP
jgi:TonB family protein